MEAKPGFVCAQCGTAHEGYPTDRGYTLPDDVWAIPESERQTLAKFTTDLCKMGGRWGEPFVVVNYGGFEPEADA